jgi:hypothetical protein
MPLPLRSQLPEQVADFANGKNIPILLHFWAESCCLSTQHLANMREYYERFGRDGRLLMIAVHTPLHNQDDDHKHVSQAIAERHIPYAVVIDEDRMISQAFCNTELPSSYLFDALHQLRFVQAGESGLTLLKQRMQALIVTTEE